MDDKVSPLQLLTGLSEAHKVVTLIYMDGLWRVGLDSGDYVAKISEDKDPQVAIARAWEWMMRAGKMEGRDE